MNKTSKTIETTATIELNDADLTAVSGGVVQGPNGETCTDWPRKIFRPILPVIGAF